MKRFGIKSEFNIWIITFITIFLIAHIVSLLHLSRLNAAQDAEVKKNITSHISTFIENKLGNIDKIQTSLMLNDKVQVVLSSTDQKKVQEAYSQLLKDVYEIQRVNVDVIYAMLIDNNGKVHNLTTTISSDEQKMIEKVYNEYLLRKEKTNTSDYDFFELGSSVYNSKYLCNFATVKVFDYERYTNLKIGTLIVCAKVDTRSVFQYTDYENLADLDLKTNYRTINIVENAKKYQRGKSIEINEEAILDLGWIVEGKVYSERAKNLIYKIRNLFLYEIVLILLFGFLLRYILSRRIAKPLKETMTYLESCVMVEKIIPLNVKGNDDIKLLAGNINDMIIRNKALAKDLVKNQQTLYDAEIAKKEALIYAMQNQVNPHFLYNILELIRSIAVVYDVEEIEKISVNMAKLFRYNLNDNLKVLIKDEIEIVKKYLYITELRFGKVFDVHFDIDENLYDAEIIKMTFQPLIENAFNHGLGDFKRKFMLVIKVKDMGDFIHLSVTDNGNGIDEKILENMNLNLKENKFFSKNKIGLANLNNRLNLAYGSNYSFEVLSKESCYTKVVIKIKKV